MPYSPEELRDFHGRWTTGGHHDDGPKMAVTDEANVEKAHVIAKIAADVAKELDYDPKLVTISDGTQKFMLNGKEYTAAGLAHIWDAEPRVTIFATHTNESSAPGLIAHEIYHQKYQAFLNDYDKDQKAMQQDPDYNKTNRWGSGPDGAGIMEHGFMKPNGELNAPYRDRYPAYNLYHETRNQHMESDYAKSDGVTGYSREWWDARAKTEEREYVADVNTGRVQKYTIAAATQEQAMHETIAEIAMLRYEMKRDKEAHDTNIKYIKENGGEWTDQNEKDWLSRHRSRLSHIVRKENGFLTTRKGIDPIWNALYKAVDANWKRRQKAARQK